MATEALPKLLLTIPQVSETTHYSRSFIYEAIAAGSLKVVRKGRTIRVSAEDLRAWIEDQG
ncbi:MAG: helix-turn-helix domain-containing protein [Dehalococcoidia bacterium]|jgi:excisionase family DNA binding protein|nr:helix-turn-helix domain-containing protein [Dehalococcoidia bacterium]